MCLIYIIELYEMMNFAVPHGKLHLHPSFKNALFETAVHILLKV